MGEEFFKDLEVFMDEKREELDLELSEGVKVDLIEDVFIGLVKEIDL